MQPTTIRLIRITFWCSAVLLAIASLAPIDLLPRQAATIWDKAQHAFGFAWLGVFGLMAHVRKPWTVLVALLLYGGAIEMLQAFTGWRVGEWLDLLADGIGLLIGAAIWLRVRRSVPPQL